MEEIAGAGAVVELIGGVVPSAMQKQPSRCSKHELDAFEDMVKRGGEVPAEGLRKRIERAEWLVFLYAENDVLAGIAALKRPKDTYKNKVFRKAKATEKPADYGLEAGWVFVDEGFRGNGYSRHLLEAVLKLAGDSPVFATTREDNDPMRRTTSHCGMKECGGAYASDRGEGQHTLVLYTSRQGLMDPRNAAQPAMQPTHHPASLRSAG